MDISKDIFSNLSLFRERFFPKGSIKPELLPSSSVIDLLENAIVSERLLGIDFETDTSGRIKIVGVALEDRAAAAYWHASYSYLIERVPKLVAYSGISADRVMLKDDDWRRWEDPMLIHYLCHQDLCAMTAKTQASDQQEELEHESYGFMNLWTATALVMPVPNWKQCRGVECSGPCPKHSPLEYCAMDAWAALAVYGQPIPSQVDPALFYRKYAQLKELAVLASEMERIGVPVDWDYVRMLESRLSIQKNAIKTDLPINPQSPKAVLAWFRDRGVHLQDTSLETLENRLESVKIRNPDAGRVLEDLIRYKRLGKGLKAWFGSRYRGNDGRIHPRIIVTGTSTGRLAMSRPNLQNVPRAGWGAHVRRAIRASPGHKLLKADFSQLELRICLCLAGVKDLSIDAFQWMVDRSPDLWNRASEMASRTPRDVTKSVAHAANYLEGFKLFDPAQLRVMSVRNAIDNGSLHVESDWEFCGKVVAFTGVNLARRLFGSSSAEDRRRALEIQRAYFSAFPELRAWQRRVLEEVERTSMIVSPYGRFLDLTALPDEEKAKVAVAFLGQGVGADLVQSCMLRVRSLGYVPILQIHDELLFELSEDKIGKSTADILEAVGQKDPVLDLHVPVKHAVGDTWG